MGASCWHYSTPYDPDPDAALQRLKNEVFQSGRYGVTFISAKDFSLLRGATITVKLIVAAAWSVTMIHFLILKIVRVFRRPRSIEEAVQFAGASGTHSILDIERCSLTPDLGLASELRPAKRRKIFGTENPTIEDLDRVGWAAPADDLHYEAVYFPVYRDGQPDLLVFVGSTGD